MTRVETDRVISSATAIIICYKDSWTKRELLPSIYFEVDYHLRQHYVLGLLCKRIHENRVLYFLSKIEIIRDEKEA